jgi:putative DNA primase/helicase
MSKINVPAPPSDVILRALSSYQMENIRWQWPYWLARGKLHLLAGPPGVAKTTLALRMAATISTGGTWPDGTQARQGDVVMWTGEDSITDTIKPRLVAMSADTKRIHIISAVEEEGKARQFDPAADIAKLGSVFDRKVKPSFLILDPISNAIIGDSHKATEVRRALQPLVDLIEAHDVAALGITHFRKRSQGTNPLERVMDSVAFTAGPRLVMAAVKAADGGDNRLSRAKSNIGPEGGGFEYRLVQTHVGEDSREVDVAAQYIEWGAVLEGSARDLLAVEEPDKEGGALREAEGFLVTLLANGPVGVKEIKLAAEANGIAWRTVERAKKKLQVKADKTGVRGGWEWVLGSWGKA